MERSASVAPVRRADARPEPREIRRTGPALDRPLRSLRRLILGIAPHEVSFDRRGFRWEDLGVRQHLERVGQTFLTGYHQALDDDRPSSLEQGLATVDLAWRGFAFEGAAMALVLRDRIAPWRASRYAAFLAGPGAPHGYMVRVGAGWALARLRRSPLTPLAGADPLLRWLAVDGFGFHEAYFHGPASTPGIAKLPDYARRAYDQGMGRALWFINGANPVLIAEAVLRVAEARRADLWSGVGLACAYAGGVVPERIAALRRLAGPFESELAQGVAFAAAARAQAGNPAPHTDLACQIVCRLAAIQAADVVDAARRNLPPDGREPAYEVWRRRIRSQFQTEVASA